MASKQKARKRFTLEDAARAAADAGMDEAALQNMMKLLSPVGEAAEEEGGCKEPHSDPENGGGKEETDGGDADGLGDEWADAVGERGKRRNASATASASNPAPTVGNGSSAQDRENLRILQAKVAILETEVRTVAIESYKNLVRLSARGRVPARELHGRFNTLFKELHEYKNIIQFKRSGFSADLIFRDFSEPRKEIEHVKNALKKTRTDDKIIILPPPNAGQNPLKSIPSGLFKTVMECVDQESSDTLSASSRIKTGWPHAEAQAPRFHLESQGKVLLNGRFDQRSMECTVQMTESILLDGISIKAEELIEQARLHVASHYKLVFKVIAGKNVKLERAPTYKELKESRGLRPR